MVEDKRKNNGGHSTQTKDGFDKRKNKWREALDKASTLEDVISVIVMVKTKAITDNDIQAAKLFLEYYLGKPDQAIEVEGITPIIDMSTWK